VRQRFDHALIDYLPGPLVYAVLALWIAAYGKSSKRLETLIASS
jgi:hypothetical protein